MRKLYEDPYSLVEDTRSHPDLCLMGISEMFHLDYEKNMDIFLKNHHDLVCDYLGNMNKNLKVVCRQKSIYKTVLPIIKGNDEIGEMFNELEGNLENYSEGNLLNEGFSIIE